MADLAHQLGYGLLSFDGRTLQSIEGRYRRTSGFTITAHDWISPDPSLIDFDRLERSSSKPKPKSKPITTRVHGPPGSSQIISCNIPNPSKTFSQKPRVSLTRLPVRFPCRNLKIAPSTNTAKTNNTVTRRTVSHIRYSGNAERAAGGESEGGQDPSPHLSPIHFEGERACSVAL